MLEQRTTPPPIRLLREVATGPASAVFAAERVGAEELVAVKVLIQRTESDVERIIRLRDNGRALAQLRHRNVHWVEEAAQIGDYVALVSPWVDGIDLLEWVEILNENGTPLPGRVVCEIVRGAAVALDAALHRTPHGSTVPLRRVHRDIRPTNLMITREGDVRVLDFGTGFSALAGRAARAVALKKGLIKYMSPGRRDGKRGGPAADVYALGIVAVELFRGRWLRRLRSHNPAHDRNLAEVVARLSDLGMRTETDELALRNLLLRMVAFDPDARPEAGAVASSFMSLADRAPGPSLASFVTTDAAPWIEDPWLFDAEETLGIGLRILEAGDTLEPVADESDDDLVTAEVEAEDEEWLETPRGWEQRAGWELPDEIIDPFFDEVSLPGVPLSELESAAPFPQDVPPDVSPPQPSPVDTGAAPAVPTSPRQTPAPTPKRPSPPDAVDVEVEIESWARVAPTTDEYPGAPQVTPAPVSRRVARNEGVAILAAVGGGALLAGILLTLAALWMLSLL